MVEKPRGYLGRLILSALILLIASTQSLSDDWGGEFMKLEECVIIAVGEVTEENRCGFARSCYRFESSYDWRQPIDHERVPDFCFEFVGFRERFYLPQPVLVLMDAEQKIRLGIFDPTSTGITVKLKGFRGIKCPSTWGGQIRR